MNNDRSAIHIRPASEADRNAILRLMRPGAYNRIHLRPDCFVVAEANGQVIGIGQIKRHRDGAPELASLVVAHEWQGQGIGSVLVRTLLARHTGDLYLFCLVELEGYYERFGFRRMECSRLPASLARMHGLGNLVGRLAQLVGRRFQFLVMQTTVSTSP